jgi:transposase
MKRIPRRIFTAKFKREAIKLVTEQGLTFAVASRKLDIATQSLRTWIDQLEQGKLKSSLGASKLTAGQQRIRELERDLAIARMKRDILKKATAFFAKEAQSAGCRSEIRHDRQTPSSTSGYQALRFAQCCQERLSGMERWQVVPTRKLADMRLLVAIKAAHQRGRGIYGPKKIRDEFAAQGMIAGLNRIKRLRKQHDIRCTHKRNSASPPTPSTICQSPPIYWRGNSPTLPHPIRCG